MTFLLAFSASSIPTKAGVANSLDSRASVNARFCESLNAYSPNLGQLEAACTAARLKIHHINRKGTRSLKLKTNIHMDTFLKIMASCNTITGPLSVVVNSVTSSSTGVFGTLLLPTLTKLTTHLDASVNIVSNLAHCMDAKVCETIYLRFGTFATSQRKILAVITARGSLWADLNFKNDLHGLLVHLKQSLDVYVNHLFNYISKDLDVLNLRLSLFANLQAAIAATV
ncbi:hypothetical protein O181_076092 [Austropuccinia psidii MF-1]|uniref:Uncharacterized protein n=1 Tax=Austropuccinia psidii MF-1 TaxID=1389203 RepID=A0A9Q3FDQ4_9BASI|nr:hypothetical protein [Austropuccinia psidii MF-1]